MERNEVLLIAHEVAETEGWIWLEPVRIEPNRCWPFGRERWDVLTNWGSRGCNIRLEIDDETGQILSKGYAPR